LLKLYKILAGLNGLELSRSQRYPWIVFWWSQSNNYVREKQHTHLAKDWRAALETNTSSELFTDGGMVHLKDEMTPIRETLLSGREAQPNNEW